MTSFRSLSFQWIAIALVLAASACSDRTDPGPVNDGGSTSDLGTLADMAVIADARVDAPTDVDAGGSRDAAISDASIDATVDASSADGGGAVDAGGSCAAMDAHSEGLCEPLWGFAWNGTECFAVSGCTCGGEDCDSLFSDGASCRAAYAHCVETAVACGGRAGDTCNSNEYCDFPSGGAVCGRDDGEGVCTAAPEVCDALFAPVCGCNGVTYSNACVAAGTGHTDVASDGECPSDTTL